MFSLTILNGITFLTSLMSLVNQDSTDSAKNQRPAIMHGYAMREKNCLKYVNKNSRYCRYLNEKLKTGGKISISGTLTH